MSVADAVRFEGEVLQHPTTPVVKDTNMKKKATMNKAIMERPISEKFKFTTNINLWHIFLYSLGPNLGKSVSHLESREQAEPSRVEPRWECNIADCVYKNFNLKI